MLSPVPGGFASCAQNGQDAHETSPMVLWLQHGPSRNHQGLSPTESLIFGLKFAEAHRMLCDNVNYLLTVVSAVGWPSP